MANGHGGKRPGAGRKPKPLAEKLLDGNPGKRRPVVMNLPADNIAPKECPEYLSDFAFFGQEPSIEGIYEQTVSWLEGTGCLHLINPAFIVEYALLKTRWMECEWMVGQWIALEDAGGTGVAANPMAEMGLKYLRAANEVWGKIWEIVAQNSATDLADHAVAFISVLKHTKSDWAGKPFDLLPWQEQIVRDIFGIVDRHDGTRQFKNVFIEIPKKQGKSELAAAIALYLLCADDEFAAEIYGCAKDRKQASIIFDVARDMVLQDPTLRSLCKINETQKRIIFMPTRSFYTAVSGEVDNKMGLNIHGCIFDELLAQTDRRLFDVMTKGAGAARKQPLNFIITTAGSDRNSICWEVHQKALDIIEGRRIDSTFYPVIYAAPEDAA